MSQRYWDLLYVVASISSAVALIFTLALIVVLLGAWIDRRQK